MLLLCLCILTVLSLASCGFVSGLFTENKEYVRCDKDGTPNKDGGYPSLTEAILAQMRNITSRWSLSDGEYSAKAKIQSSSFATA